MIRRVLVFFILCSALLDARDVTVARDPNWTDVPLLGRQAALVAFTKELLGEIGKEEHLSFIIQHGNPGSLFQALDREEVDAILSPEQPFPALREHYAFSKPYLYTGPVLVVRADSGIDSLSKMAGKIVGVRAYTDGRLVAAKIPLVVIETFPSDAVALNRLVTGELDGVLMPAIPAYAFVANLYDDALKVVTPPLTPEGIRLIALKSNHKIVDKFDKGFEEVVASSRYSDLARKWHLYLDTGPSPFGG